MSNFQPIAGEFNQDGTLVKIWGPNSQVAFDPSSVAITGGKANTLVIAGDSLAASNWSTTPDTLYNVQTAGAFMWANALAGHRFTVLDNLAVGGKTAANMLTEQIPAIIQMAPKYCYFVAGTNDLYLDLVSGSVAAQRIIACIEALSTAGITPIWSTVWARSATAGVTDDHIWCNDLLRLYAMSTKVGIFYDGFRVSQLPGSATFDIRALWCRDSAPALHVNNLGAYYLGKACFKAFDSLVPRISSFASGTEDRTNSANNGSNILLNPYFSGTSGTVNTNCTGTMPDSWAIDWSTRTGTGSAAASIVDVLDPDTGLVNAKGIQIVLSGTPAAGDSIRLRQVGMQAQLTGGNMVNAEGVLTLTSPVQVIQPAMRVNVDSVSTWWGLNATPTGSGTNQPLPESAVLYMKTRPITVAGTSAPASALYDLQIFFSAGASGTFVLSQPRVRRL